MKLLKGERKGCYNNASKYKSMVKFSQKLTKCYYNTKSLNYNTKNYGNPEIKIVLTHGLIR